MCMWEWGYKDEPVHKVCHFLCVVDRRVVVGMSRVGMRDPI